MPDPITTILTTAAEHAPNAAAVTVALKAAKDFLAKVAGPAVEELGEIGRDYVKGWRAKNGSAVLAGADKLLAEAGREPQAVPLKTLLPLLDAASLEDDEALATHWAALLANAADPMQRVQIQPGFAEVLRQLTPIDARVLQHIYRNLHLVTDSDESRPPINGDRIGTYADSVREELGLDALTMQGVLDNLLRLRLSKFPEGGLGGSLLLYNTFSTIGRVLPTVFGYQFMRAVTPPAP